MRLYIPIGRNAWGRRVQHPSKGLYIYHGRKVVMK